MKTLVIPEQVLEVPNLVHWFYTQETITSIIGAVLITVGILSVWYFLPRSDP